MFCEKCIPITHSHYVIEDNQNLNKIAYDKECAFFMQKSLLFYLGRDA